MPLTIKAIIRWEQLRKKSFSLIDYANQEDIEALLYATTLCKDGVQYTFEVFRQTLSNRKLVRDMNSVECCSETIGSIVSSLIMSGLDAHYALNEMELCDLPLYIEAYEKKRKEDMESARMWTYLTILPHIDSRKMVNGAKDLIMFPWEEAEKTAAKVINETEVKRFEEFLKQGKNMFK